MIIINQTYIATKILHTHSYTLIHTYTHLNTLKKLPLTKAFAHFNKLKKYTLHTFNGIYTLYPFIFPKFCKLNYLFYISIYIIIIIINLIQFLFIHSIPFHSIYLVFFLSFFCVFLIDFLVVFMLIY